MRVAPCNVRQRWLGVADASDAGSSLVLSSSHSGFLSVLNYLQVLPRSTALHLEDARFLMLNSRACGPKSFIVFSKFSIRGPRSVQ